MKYSLEQLRSIPILFIVGKGRSGTTLLSTILDSHPEVSSATESRFLLMIWQKYKSMKRWEPKMANQFIDDVKKDIRIKYLWDFEDEFEDNLKSLPSSAKVQDLIKMVYLSRKSNFEKEDIKYIIDKNPKYTLFIDQLKMIFPDAYFFRLIRDPRDNIASQINFSKKPVGMLAYKWNKYNKKIDLFEKKYQTKCLTLRFEDLILDKYGFFKKFEEFTGISSLASLEEKRLEYKQQFESKFSDRLKKQHESSVKPLNPKKIGHFKSKLTESQIEVIESYCFPYAEQFNYVKATDIFALKSNKKIAASLNYYFLKLSNQLYYNLPFSMMTQLSKFMIKYVHSRKRSKLEEIKRSNDQ